MTYLVVGITAFGLGFAVRHVLGHIREMGAWQEGYYWGERHEVERWAAEIARAEREATPGNGAPVRPEPDEFEGMRP